MEKETRTDLLTGSVGRALVRFAIPFLIAVFLQNFYGMVDITIVGRFTDAAGVAAVATGSQVMHAVTSLLVGLTTGGTVLIGQYIGAGRRADVSHAIGAMFTLFTVLAVALSGVLLLLVDPIVSAMNVPGAAVADARRYLFLSVCGMVFVAGYNTVSGILRGLGDSTRPMIFIGIACVLNILGDLLLVGLFGMGPAGAAIATIAAQAVSLLLSVQVLRRGDFPFDFKLPSFLPQKDKVAGLLRLGTPIALQNVLVSVSFLLITAIVNEIGLNQSAAVGVVEQIISFCMLAPAAFQSAVSAMTAQNMGAGRQDRAKSAMWWGVGCSLLFGGVMFLLLQLLPDQTMGLFIQDDAVITQGALYLRTYSIDCLLVCLVFCLNGFFSGCGRTGFTMANCLIATFLLRVPVVFFLSRVPGVTLFHIGLAAPLASGLQILVQLVYLKLGAWRRSLFTPPAEGS